MVCVQLRHSYTDEQGEIVPMDIRYNHYPNTKARYRSCLLHEVMELSQLPLRQLSLGIGRKRTFFAA